MHYPPDLNPPAEQTGEDANSAYEKSKNSVGASVDAIPTLGINTQPAHPIELADGRHHRSWISLDLGLASRLQQGLNAPSQHLLTVEVWAFDVVMDLTPCPLQQSVAL